jgi:hypothetical protein
MSLKEPIMSLETDVSISHETIQAQTYHYTGTPSQLQIEIDNTFNLQQDDNLQIKIIPLSTGSPSIIISSIVIAGFDNDNDQTITFTTGHLPTITSGHYLLIKDNTIYLDTTEYDYYSFNSPLFLYENEINVLKINLDLSSTGNFDIEVSFKKSSSVETIQAYVQGLSFTENITLKRLGKLKPKYNLVTDISYEFSIDKLWLDSNFWKYDEDQTFCIKYYTNDSNANINSQAIYLCGVKFNGKTLSRGEIDEAKEGVRGVVTGVFLE